jgi:hypothetical protein
VGTDSSAGGYGRRCGFGRTASFLAIALAAIAVVASGCGDSGHGAETNPEKGSDAEILNEGLSRELTLVEAYTRGNRLLRGPERALGRQLRAQEHEYVDALTKAIRGLGGDTDAEAEEVDFKQVKDQVAFLALAGELENAALDFYVDQAAQLYTAAPRKLDAWLAAGHGGHVALLPGGGG